MSGRAAVRVTKRGPIRYLCLPNSYGESRPAIIVPPCVSDQEAVALARDTYPAGTPNRLGLLNRAIGALATDWHPAQ